MGSVVNQAWPSYTFCICLFVLYPRFELKYTDFLCLQIWKCGEKRGYHCQQPQINYRPFTRIINLRSTINLLTIDPLIGLSTLDQPIYPSLILSSLDQLSTLHWYYQPQINYRPFTGIINYRPVTVMIYPRAFTGINLRTNLEAHFKLLQVNTKFVCLFQEHANKNQLLGVQDASRSSSI